MYTGANIVRNGLVLALDAANTRSYPGSGTTCYDLYNINNTGSLINGPTFNSANGGSIVFDGSNDYIRLMNVNTILANDNFTIDLWCRPSNTVSIVGEATGGITGTSGQRYITDAVFGTGPTAGTGVSVGTNAIGVFEHADYYMPALLFYTATISNIIFSHIVITYTNKQPRAYLNGVLVRTGLTSARSSVSLKVGAIGGQLTNYGFFAGGLASVKYYNRTLSSSEILQNYNSQKSRYNL